MSKCLQLKTKWKSLGLISGLYYTAEVPLKISINFSEETEKMRRKYPKRFIWTKIPFSNQQHLRVKLILKNPMEFSHCLGYALSTKMLYSYT